MYKIKTCEKTCSACPSQWDLYTDRDEYIYVRFRWGYLSVSIGVNGQEIFSWEDDDDWNGTMSTEKMIEFTKSVLDFTNATFS